MHGASRHHSQLQNHCDLVTTLYELTLEETLENVTSSGLGYKPIKLLGRNGLLISKYFLHFHQRFSARVKV